MARRSRSEILISPTANLHELVRTKTLGAAGQTRWLIEPVRIRVASVPEERRADVPEFARLPRQICTALYRGEFRMSASFDYVGVTIREGGRQGGVLQRLHATWLHRAEVCERLIDQIMTVLSTERSTWRASEKRPYGMWRPSDLAIRLADQINFETIRFVLEQLAACRIVTERKGATSQSESWFEPNLNHEAVTRMEAARGSRLGCVVGR